MQHLRSHFLSFAFCTLAFATAQGGCSTTNIITDGDGTSSADDGGDGSSSDSSSDDSEDSSGTSGGDWEPCSDASPCPDGQFCFNGLCALGCTSDGDCADNQYCDTSLMLCQNDSVPTCASDDECAGEQICLNGLCSVPAEGSCNPDAVVSGQDGCESNAVCLYESDDSTSCYQMPACAEDDTCPVGTEGAVCNVDYINKDRICLIGLCETGDHCPADWSCVRHGNEVLGVCSSGASGFPCNDGTDCLSGNCEIFIPGSPGFCQ